MAEFWDSAPSLPHRRGNPYDPPADAAPRRDPYYPIAAGASSDAPPCIRRSTSYEPSRFHYTPYDRPAAATPRRDPYYPVAAPPYYPVAAPPYYPVAAGASSEATPRYHPIAAGASSDATPRLSTNAPRPSPYNDSEFPTIGPLFLPPNFDSVRPSEAPRRSLYDPTITGPVPAGAAYHGVIDATKYDHRASRARRGKVICALCNTKGYHLPTSCPYMVVATQLEIFRSRPPNNLRFQDYLVEGRRGVHGCGIGNYAPPRRDVAERASDVAVSLQKDGLNLVRITNLPDDMKPEALYRLCDKFGAVTNAIIFIDLSLGFVNFVRVEDAEKAMKELNTSGFGHLMWASQTPQ